MVLKHWDLVHPIIRNFVWTLVDAINWPKRGFDLLSLKFVLEVMYMSIVSYAICILVCVKF